MSILQEYSLYIRCTSFLIILNSIENSKRSELIVHEISSNGMQLSQWCTCIWH